MRLIALLLLALLAACGDGEAPCVVTPEPGIPRAWCEGVPVRVVVGDGCELDAVRAAVALWTPETDAWTVERGAPPALGAERFGEVYVAQGDVSAFGDGRIANTRSHAVDHVQRWARTTITDCSDVRLLGHELGHAIGVAHSDTAQDLMGDGWDVPAETFDALRRVRGDQ